MVSSLFSGLSKTRPSSVRCGTRQRLQHPSIRRVHAAANAKVISYIDQNRSDSLIPRFSLIEPESNVPDDSPPPIRSKTIFFKKIQAVPIEVRIRCIFLRVGEIDTLNERYYAELLLEASWEDESLEISQTRTFEPTVNWTPELELINGIGELHDDIMYSVKYDKHGLATVTEHHKLKGTLWERMELQHFPFDVQELSLSLTTSRSDSEMRFVVDLKKPSGVNRRVFTDEQEWHLFEHVDIEITEQIDEYLDNGHSHPVVTCSSHAARSVENSRCSRLSNVLL